MVADNVPIVIVERFAELGTSLTETVKFRSEADCHFTTVPTFPAKVKSAGAVPWQMVWLAETVPPTDVGLTVMVTDALLEELHTPFLTTTL